MKDHMSWFKYLYAKTVCGLNPKMLAPMANGAKWKKYCLRKFKHIGPAILQTLYCRNKK